MNSRIYLIALFWILFGWNAEAQCPTNPLFFTIQDSISNFPNTYPNCHTINNVAIAGDDITNLSSLSQLTNINGHLSLDSCTNLNSLQGLNQIQTVSGDLTIDSCTALSNLQGLNSIQTIGQALTIIRNSNLYSLDGINSLQSISGSLIIKSDTLLNNIHSLSGLTSIGYSLNIIDNDALLSLNGLNNITSVGQRIIIGGNGHLTNLEGLQNIETIGGTLVIAENYALNSISQLNKITIIPDSLDIRRNPKLTSLTGLQNITEIGGKVAIEFIGIPDLAGLGNVSIIHDSLIIKNNPKLVTLEGLTNLSDVDHLLIQENDTLSTLEALISIQNFHGSIQIIDNDSLTNLKGLDSIMTIPGELAITYNDNLTSFEGLNNLETIEGFLAFRNNPQLSDITALMNLDSVLGDFVFIAENNSLQSLSGLDNMFYIGGSAIDIKNNPLLSTCGVPSICHHITYANFANIFNNAPGCNNTNEIESTCGGPVIQGLIYNDANNNCTRDPGEVPLPNWPVLAINDTDTLVDYTDNYGYYKIFTPGIGYYRVTTTPPLTWTETCTGVSDSFFVNGPQDVHTIHFFGHQDTTCSNLFVDISNGNLTPCKPTIFKVKYCNNGTKEALDAKIEIDFSDEVTINSSPVPYTNIGDNTYLFDIGAVPFGKCNEFSILGTLSCDFVEQQAICASAKITPNNYCTPDDPNWSKASLKITGECDADSIRFTIKNIGENMLTTQVYDFVVDDWILLKTNVNLPKDSTISVAVIDTSQTATLRGPQVPFHPGSSHPLLTLEGCSTNDQGTFSTGYMLQFPEDDADPFISIDCQEITENTPTSSHQNFPKGYGAEHYVTADQGIEYKINFHNTSQDTLRNIVITEAISEYLDLTTIELGAMSDPYDLKIINNNMIFHLKNLHIPPADSNYAASFGFVKFKIHPKVGLENGTVISNYAMVNYGASKASEANQVFNTIGKDFVIVSITNPNNQHIGIKTYPNPFVDYTTFDFSEITFKSGQITIYDQIGRVVRQEKINSNSFILNRKDLTQGIYSFEIIFDNKIKANGKINVF